MRQVSGTLRSMKLPVPGEQARRRERKEHASCIQKSPIVHLNLRRDHHVLGHAASSSRRTSTKSDGNARASADDFRMIVTSADGRMVRQRTHRDGPANGRYACFRDESSLKSPSCSWTDDRQLWRRGEHHSLTRRVDDGAQAHRRHPGSRQCSPSSSCG